LKERISNFYSANKSIKKNVKYPFYSSKNPEKVSHFFLQKYELLSVLIIRNVSWAANQYIIRMISEGSCDPED